MKRRTLLVLPAVTLLLGLGGGAAFGYFTSSGSGTGHGSDGNMQVVTVAAITSQTPDTVLQPGSSGEVIIRVDNTNSVPVRLVSVEANGSVGVSGGTGCTAGNSGVSFTSQTGLSIPIAASTTALVRLPGSASMSLSSANGCQGATFDIPVTITVDTP